RTAPHFARPCPAGGGRDRADVHGGGAHRAVVGIDVRAPDRAEGAAGRALVAVARPDGGAVRDRGLVPAVAAGGHTLDAAPVLRADDDEAAAPGAVREAR